MKHLTKFKTIVVYDFDGTLHLTVDKYGNPLDYYMDPVYLKPNWPTIKQLKKDALSHRIVVISARNIGDESYIEKFINLYHLPVDAIFCTSNRSKLPMLQQLNAEKIYDDNPKVERDVENSGIEFSYPIYN